jgi:hypothetical protein
MATITSKKIFYINSRNRISGNDADFMYQIDLHTDDDFDKVCVLQAIIPKSYYVIPESGNTFDLTENGITETITVTSGNYSRKSFATTLETLLNAHSPLFWTYTVSYGNPATGVDVGKYTFTVADNGGLQPSFTFSAINNVNESMGFDRSATYTFSANTLQSQDVIKLISEDTLFIHSDICQNSTSDNILQEVFGSAGSGNFSNILFQNFNVDAYSKNLVTNSSNIFRFYLTDEDDNQIDLNGLNINITLICYKSNNIYTMIKDFIKYITLQN